MANAEQDKDFAFWLYVNGHSLRKIGREMGATDTTIRRWKHDGEWDDEAARKVIEQKMRQRVADEAAQSKDSHAAIRKRYLLDAKTFRVWIADYVAQKQEQVQRTTDELADLGDVYDVNQRLIPRLVKEATQGSLLCVQMANRAIAEVHSEVESGRSTYMSKTGTIKRCQEIIETAARVLQRVSPSFNDEMANLMLVIMENRNGDNGKIIEGKAIEANEVAEAADDGEQFEYDE